MRRRARPTRTMPTASALADRVQRDWIRGQAQDRGLSEAVVASTEAEVIRATPDDLNRPGRVRAALEAEALRHREAEAQVRLALGDKVSAGHGFPARLVERARAAGSDRLVERALAMVPSAMAELAADEERARVQGIAGRAAEAERQQAYAARLAREAEAELALRDPSTAAGRIRLALEAAAWLWSPGSPGYEVSSPDGFGLRTVGRHSPGWYVNPVTCSSCPAIQEMGPRYTEAARRLDEEGIADLLREQARLDLECHLARQAEHHRRAEELARAEARETAASLQRRQDQATDGLSDDAETIARAIVEAGAWDDNDGRDGSLAVAEMLSRHAARPDALPILRAVARRYGTPESRLTDMVMARLR